MCKDVTIKDGVNKVKNVCAGYLIITRTEWGEAASICEKNSHGAVRLAFPFIEFQDQVGISQNTPVLSR